MGTQSWKTQHGDSSKWNVSRVGGVLLNWGSMIYRKYTKISGDTEKRFWEIRHWQENREQSIYGH